MHSSLAVLADREITHEKAASVSSHIDYFRSRLGPDRTIEWLRDVKASGRKVIGVMGWGVPLEIVLASGAVPVQLIGVWTNARASRRKLPRDTCPLAASCFVGANALSREGLLDAAAVPLTCDWKRKLAELLAEFTAVLTLQPPVAGDSASLEAELKNFARGIALVTDVPVTARNRDTASAEIATTGEAFTALQRLRRHSSCSLSGANALAVEQTFMRDDFPRWMEHCRSLVRSLEREQRNEKEKVGEPAPRILLVGSPTIWKERCLVQFMEEAGARVICDDFRSHPSLLVSPSVPPGPSSVSFPAVAARWARACFCSLVGGEDENFLLHATKDFGVHAVIGHIYRSCARLQMKMPAFLRRLDDDGIPSLALETEDDPNESGRLFARIEAFVEVLLATGRCGT